MEVASFVYKCQCTRKQRNWTAITSSHVYQVSAELYVCSYVR